MKIRIGMALAAASLFSVFVTASPATASVDKGPTWAHIKAPNGQIRCWAITNVRSSDGYVQGKFQSEWYGADTHACIGWLERKVLGSGGYDWKKVSNEYEVYDSYKSTGFHWNGTNAGSRVCIVSEVTYEKVCSTGVW